MVEGRRHGGEDSIGSSDYDRPSMDAIVFDWDGTLIDTLPAIIRADAVVLGEYGISIDPAGFRAAYAPDWRLMYQRLGIPDAELEAAGARWLALYRAAGEASLLPGAAAALHRLRAAGYVLGLVTAGDREVVEEQLTRAGLDELLRVRICGDDPVASKPHPEPLLRALDELGVRHRQVHARYVGDAPDDMRMALAAGATGIGIVSALGTRADLLAAGAREVHPSVATWVDGFVGRAAEEAR
jgi:HAD superfamily hydrolase (TIGR01509 family)